MQRVINKDKTRHTKLISWARSFAKALNTRNDDEYDAFMSNFEPAQLAYLLNALADELEEVKNGNV